MFKRLNYQKYFKKYRFNAFGNFTVKDLKFAKSIFKYFKVEYRKVRFRKFQLKKSVGQKKNVKSNSRQDKKLSSSEGLFEKAIKILKNRIFIKPLKKSLFNKRRIESKRLSLFLSMKKKEMIKFKKKVRKISFLKAMEKLIHVTLSRIHGFSSPSEIIQLLKHRFITINYNIAKYNDKLLNKDDILGFVRMDTIFALRKVLLKRLKKKSIYKGFPRHLFINLKLTSIYIWDDFRVSSLFYP
jgi:hypothetical protein